MFSCKALESIDLSGFDTTKAESMANMFTNCSALTSVKLPKTKPSGVTSVSSMFAGCASLTALDLSGFDTSQVTDMGAMFSGCSALASVDLSGFDTSSVSSMNMMFGRCESLSTIILGERFSFKGDVDLRHGGWMAEKDGGLYLQSSMPNNRADTYRWDAKWLPVGTCAYRVTDDSTLVVRPLPYADGEGTLPGEGDFPWENEHLVSVRFEGTIHALTCEDMFYKHYHLLTADLRNLETSQVTNMSRMFYGCSRLTSIDFTDVDTSHVTSRQNMFDDCRSLATVKLGSSFAFGDEGLLPEMCWVAGSDGARFTPSTIPANQADTYSYDEGWHQSGTCLWKVDEEGTLVVGVIGREGTGRLDEGDWRPWRDYDTYRDVIVRVRFEGTVIAPACDIMFGDCSALEEIDLSGLDTSSVKGMYGMFDCCASLREIDLSGLDTSNVENMDSLFNGCMSLTKVKFGEIDTSHVTDMSRMFCDCSSLRSVDLSQLDMSLAEGMGTSNMFYGCKALTSVTAGNKTRLDLEYAGAEDKYNWYSTTDHAWYDTWVILNERYGIPDVYTSTEAGADVPDVPDGPDGPDSPDGPGRQDVITVGDLTVAMGAAASLGATSSQGSALVYESDNESVATVSSQGEVTPHHVGQATITVTVAGGDAGEPVTATAIVAVLQGKQDISAQNKTVTVGKRVSLGAKSGQGSRLRYRSSDSAKATVAANGVVTGKSGGTVTITIIAEGSDDWQEETKVVKVTVKKAANTLRAKAKKKSLTVKLAKVKKASVKLSSNVAVTGVKGKVSFKNVSTASKAKKIKVNAKTGAITVPKGTKKGTYKIVVKVTAAGNAAYKASMLKVAYKVVVK